MYAFDKWIQSRCKFSDFQLLVWKLTIFLMSFLSPQRSFCLKFATPFSVVTHNSSESFYLKQYMLLTKRAHQCTIFRLGCSNDESSPNCSCHFWNHKVRVFKISHHCSVSWKIIPLYFFQRKPHILWTRIANRSEIFRLLSGWVKIHQILHVIFEMTSQFFFKLCITLQCHGT